MLLPTHLKAVASAASQEQEVALPDSSITFPHATFSNSVRFTQPPAWMKFVLPLVWGIWAKLKSSSFRKDLHQTPDIMGLRQVLRNCQDIHSVVTFLLLRQKASWL